MLAQNIKQIDSVAKVMCTYLETLHIKNDTLKITRLYEEQLYPYLDMVTAENINRVGQQVYYRLQRNCVSFRDLLDRLEPPKEASVRMGNKPTSIITNKQLKEFKKKSKFYYFEVSGDTTNVLMSNGKWTDTFTNNTYSKLTYTWRNKTEFELVFVESNNHTRSFLSVAGDSYWYQVLAKEDGYYLLSLTIPEQDMYETFKFYYY